MKSTLDEQLKELGEKLEVKPQAKDELKRRVLDNVSSPHKVRRGRYGWAVAVICLLVLTSPFYSTTMAGIASKILPLDIRSSMSEEGTRGLWEDVLKIVEEEGYVANSVSITPSPYTIEINLIGDKNILKDAQEALSPIVEAYLTENGYDQYELVFSEMEEMSPSEDIDETGILIDEVHEIVVETFTAYGYAEEAAQQGVQLERAGPAYIVTIDMPDHVTEADKMVADMMEEYNTREMNIKEIKVKTYNLAHRQQDSRWGMIASDIYDAMAGKSAYQVTGLSYKVKKGHAYVWLRTDFTKRPGGELSREIEAAVHKYLDMPETAEPIREDTYTIQFLLKDETPFLEVTNKD